jgi:two-component sensor histidine kinase/PAS domain-containing protein
VYTIVLYTESLWRDIWLIVISFLLFTGTLYIYFRLRSSTFSRFADLLEERVQIKTRQLVEKNIELEKLSLVASRTDNAVLIAGPGGVVDWVNEGFIARYRKTSVDVIGSKISLLGVHERVEAEIAAAITERHSRIFESHFVNGEVDLWISTTLTPIYDENTQELRKLLFVDADISATKKMQEQIQRSLREKDVLLKEIHHRVKNNLQIIISLLNLQSGYIKDAATLKAVKDGQLRVRSMALVHEKFYQAEELLEINFGEYIDKLCQYLYQAYGDRTDRIKIKLNVDPVGLDMDTAMPCGLLVNEIVSNSYKYAFPDGYSGSITIDFHRLDGAVQLKIQDDGIGLPAGFLFESAESLGMQLIQALTSQLDGNVEVDRKNGTAFSVIFPYPKHTGGNPATHFKV